MNLRPNILQDAHWNYVLIARRHRYKTLLKYTQKLVLAYLKRKTLFKSETFKKLLRKFSWSTDDSLKIPNIENRIILLYSPIRTNWISYVWFLHVCLNLISLMHVQIAFEIKMTTVVSVLNDCRTKRQYDENKIDLYSLMEIKTASLIPCRFFVCLSRCGLKEYSFFKSSCN